MWFALLLTLAALPADPPDPVDLVRKSIQAVNDNARGVDARMVEDDPAR